VIDGGVFKTLFWALGAVGFVGGAAMCGLVSWVMKHVQVGLK
jgi:hypothetical protein